MKDAINRRTFLGTGTALGKGTAAASLLPGGVINRAWAVPATSDGTGPVMMIFNNECRFVDDPFKEQRLARIAEKTAGAPA